MKSRPPRVFFPVLTALAVFSAGCFGAAPVEDDGRPGRAVASSAADAPVSVTLALENATAFFTAGGSRLTLTAEPAWPVDDFVAGVTLPDGVEVLSGALRHEGPAQPTAPVTLTATVRATAPGEFVLRGWAEAPMGPGGRAAPAVLLGIRGSAENASVFEPRSQAPDFRVTLDVRDGDAILLVSSPVNVSARLELVYPTPQVAVTGPTEWPLNLTREGEALRTVPVTFTENGTVQLTAALYPDPAVDGRLHHHTVFVTVDGDAVTVSERPPDRGEPTGNETPEPDQPDPGDGGTSGNATAVP